MCAEGDAADAQILEGIVRYPAGVGGEHDVSATGRGNGEENPGIIAPTGFGGMAGVVGHQGPGTRAMFGIQENLISGVISPVQPANGGRIRGNGDSFCVVIMIRELKAKPAEQLIEVHDLQIVSFLVSEGDQATAVFDETGQRTGFRAVQMRWRRIGADRLVVGIRDEHDLDVLEQLTRRSGSTDAHFKMFPQVIEQFLITTGGWVPVFPGGLKIERVQEDGLLGCDGFRDQSGKVRAKNDPDQNLENLE